MTDSKLENIISIINIATSICILHEEIQLNSEDKLAVIPLDAILMLKQVIINYDKNIYDNIQNEITKKIDNNYSVSNNSDIILT